MLDIEALEEAVIFARAAVEIRPHEVIEITYDDYLKISIFKMNVYNCKIKNRGI